MTYHHYCCDSMLLFGTLVWCQGKLLWWFPHTFLGTGIILVAVGAFEFLDINCIDCSIVLMLTLDSSTFFRMCVSCALLSLLLLIKSS